MSSSSTPPPGRGPSHYERLEVSIQATAAELRQAFRLQSKRLHPDTTTLPREQAAEGFRRLQEAYAVLIDPGSRQRYDALLQASMQAPAASTPPAPAPGRPPAAMARPVGVRRSLSGGEWFALLLLAMALVLSLVLGIGVAWARGAALVRSPSWLPETVPAAGPPFPAASGGPSPAAAGGPAPAASGPSAVSPVVMSSPDGHPAA